MSKQKIYAIKITYTCGSKTNLYGKTWKQILTLISDPTVVDACIRLIGSDPL